MVVAQEVLQQGYEEDAFITKIEIYLVQELFEQAVQVLVCGTGLVCISDRVELDAI